jgi:uncharacterized protein (DUF58 family)
MAEVGEGTRLPDTSLLARRPWYWLGLLCIIISIPLHQGLIFVAGLLMLTVGFVPDLWYRFCLTGLTYTRRLSQTHALFGETITLAISVENRKPLPLPWLEVEDELPDALPLQGGRLDPTYKPHRALLVNTLSLWWYQRLTRRYTLHCTARGLYVLGPGVMRSGDPFGFLVREAPLAQEDTLLIYPPIVPIERLGLPARHPFGERKAPRRLLEDPTRFAGTREYVYGDSLRHIHWKATARTMRLQSKIYEPTTTHTLTLFLNVNTFPEARMGFNPALLELVVTAAASVASWAIDQGYAVGLYANAFQTRLRALQPGEDMRIRLKPATGHDQIARLLEALARIVPYFVSPLEPLLTAESYHLPFGATVIVISAAAALEPALLTSLQRLRSHGHAVALLLAGDSAPIDTGDLLAYHIGGEERWYELRAELLGESAQPLPTAVFDLA